MGVPTQVLCGMFIGDARHARKACMQFHVHTWLPMWPILTVSSISTWKMMGHDSTFERMAVQYSRWGGVLLCVEETDSCEFTIAETRHTASTRCWPQAATEAATHTASSRCWPQTANHTAKPTATPTATHMASTWCWPQARAHTHTHTHLLGVLVYLWRM